MSCLNKIKIKNHQNWLAKWRTPKAMKCYSNKLMDYMHDDLFIQAGVGFIRESYAAAHFANLRCVQKVRLVPGDRPDFQIWTGYCVEGWEFTEALKKGRRRGDEYRSASKSNMGILKTNVRDSISSDSTKILDALKESTIKKAKKNYPPNTRLLIYLNTDDYAYSTPPQNIKDVMIEATKPAKDAFAEVWVLWKEKACPLWVQGIPVPV